MKKFAIIILSALLLSGCGLYEDYVMPYFPLGTPIPAYGYYAAPARQQTVYCNPVSGTIEGGFYCY